MIPEYGSNWFLPYCADYEGDLQAVENFSAALQDGGAAAARFLTLVDPNGATDLSDILEAENLDVVPGRQQDVHTLRSDKGGDLRVTSEEMEKASRRLGQAFLMFSSIQRSGERVTAEEWKILATEIDQAMGGLYSSVSQTSQRFFVLRFIHLHEETDPQIGKLPEGLVRIAVVTGIDSLGSSSELSRFKEFMADANELGNSPTTAKYMSISDGLRRLATYHNIKSEGLILPEEQVQARDADEQNKAMQQSLMERQQDPQCREEPP
ncbi:hypothetical protein HGG76_02480 [Ochrobactrum tritici]|uniref:Uncharacterized protein n=1 Tax=Brucella tritici TaxID=94626 RepID=A0A7X6FNM6_9HYPH|nr:hypothetical protein [Brucella tritici]